MREIYIKKKNGRYKNIGQEFQGFPVNGIWLVVDGSMNCVTKIEDIVGKNISHYAGAEHTYQVVLDTLRENHDTAHAMTNAITTALHLKEK